MPRSNLYFSSPNLGDHFCCCIFFVFRVSPAGTQTTPFKSKHSNFVCVCFSFCHICDCALFHFTARRCLFVFWPPVSSVCGCQIVASQKNHSNNFKSFCFSQRSADLPERAGARFHCSLHCVVEESCKYTTNGTQTKTRSVLSD